MARHRLSQYSRLHESEESIRRQEIGRLRLMAAEAARSGDRLEARKLDVMADEAAQTAMEKIQPKKRRLLQLKLWE